MPESDALTAERLLARLPGGFPPPRSKLQVPTWQLAAQLFAASNGRVKLRELCSACRVSHRTAWRLREALRDSAAMIADDARRSALPPRHRHPDHSPQFQGDAR
jgi:hypothetical protein